METIRTDFSHPLFANAKDVFARQRHPHQDAITTITPYQDNVVVNTLDFDDLRVRPLIIIPKECIDASKLFHPNLSAPTKFDPLDPQFPLAPDYTHLDESFPKPTLGDITLDITPRQNLIYIGAASPEYPSKADFYSIFHQYAKPTYNTDGKRSFPVLDSFSTEKINQLGELLINCHVFELLTQTQEAYSESEITSVKSQSRDKKTDRIGLSLNTKNGWIRITSDGERIFITKNNDYYRTLNPTLLGIESTQEKLNKILNNDAKRLFPGQQPSPLRRTYLSPIPNNKPSRLVKN